MWEKKSDDGSLHDKDNTYRWAGRCYDGGNNWVGTYCQPDAAAATACAAGTRSASTVGCGQCGSRETGNLFGVPTIWQWLVAVNAEGGTGFAGHNDWQIPLQIPPVASQGTPTAFELDSLVNVGASGCGWGSPCAYSAFNTRCVGRCTVALCSCTQSGKYWSATTSVRGLTGAWDVLFDSGGREISNKYFPHYVRAVRGGP